MCNSACGCAAVPVPISRCYLGDGDGFLNIHAVRVDSGGLAVDVQQSARCKPANSSGKTSRNNVMINYLTGDVCCLRAVCRIARCRVGLRQSAGF